jgi:16S rRNA (cytosine967-C5)-methyltransferase
VSWIFSGRTDANSGWEMPKQSQVLTLPTLHPHAAELREAILNKLTYACSKTPSNAGAYDWYLATVLAVRELNPQPGEAVLDLCAAPGGKLTYIAQLMRNEGRIVAHEISKERLELINENCARLGVTCVNPVLSSALDTRSSEALLAKEDRPSPLFDLVLLDAPCSNTGVMRRRVDLRWRLQPKEIQRLKAAQLDLLRQAAKSLKAGGTLVYSTCSLESEENQEVIAQFLSEMPQFRLVRERELLPFVDETDGAYVATLVG